MPIRRHAAIAAAFVLAGAAPALADDYPFSGVFVAPIDEVPAADKQLLCGYNFFVQNNDGTFINYHLDLPAYEKDGTIRFVTYTRGHCKIEDKVETCTTDWDSDPKYIGEVYFDIIAEVGAESVKIAYFDTADEARANADKAEPTDTFYRCPFDEAAIAKYRTETVSTLTGDARMAMFRPDLDDKARAAMTDVLAAIAAGK